MALAVGLYFFAGWVGSSIPSNRNFVEDPNGVEIIVATNGIHTSIAVPLTSPDMDWTRVFPPSDTADPSRPYTHVAISWGERAVFLETETWADLSPMTVMRVIGVGGDALYHVEQWVRPAPSPDFRPLRISRAQYRRLIRALLRDLPERTAARAVYPGYATHDVFYDARGTYTTYNTCNEWTGETLRLAGIRTGAWTPFAGSVMKWVPPIEPAERGVGTR
ncbi:hypothetical protein AB433_11720 [Croceicoccus naphthovorans]|uniref:Urease-associated protein n=1 Tax=Croceicoccus naphthovorans TaxID=1348774 RepID=A0A0G3XMB3_9SPHN|nr:hypothetical protein AB433_11720 [Croceicoccus naphthovorans]